MAMHPDQAPQLSFAHRLRVLGTAVLVAAVFAVSGCSVFAPPHPRSADMEVARTSIESLEETQLGESLSLGGDEKPVTIKQLWERAFGTFPAREPSTEKLDLSEVIGGGASLVFDQLKKSIDRESKKYASQFIAGNSGIRLATERQAEGKRVIEQSVFALDIQRVTAAFPRAPDSEPSFRLIFGVNMTLDTIGQRGHFQFVPLYYKTNSTPAKVLDHRWWNWAALGLYHLVLDPTDAVSTQVSISVTGLLTDGSVHSVLFTLPEFSEDLDEPEPTCISLSEGVIPRRTSQTIPRMVAAEIPFRLSGVTVSNRGVAAPVGKPAAVFAAPNDSVSVVATIRQFDTSKAYERFSSAADAIPDKKE